MEKAERIEKSPRKRSRASTIAHVAGNALLIVGAVALVWAFVIWRWGDPATGLYTRWQQHELTQTLAATQKHFQPPPAAGANDGVTHVSAAAQRADARRSAHRLGEESHEGDPLGRIKVQRLGLNMIVVDGTGHDALKKGPGIDRRTSLPGQARLVYIAGHRTTYGAPFAHIDRLRRGDRIELDMPYGTYVYRVTSWVIVPATDLSRLRTHGYEEIALQACHPRFSARERYIVYGRPVSGPGIGTVS